MEDEHKHFHVARALVGPSAIFKTTWTFHSYLPKYILFCRQNLKKKKIIAYFRRKKIGLFRRHRW
uniref:Uncharacterized protein n=1 Tax=Rhizophora mucronata TaxID=61149 RepID=A0A2P2P3Q1_RHIMU